MPFRSPFYLIHLLFQRYNSGMKKKELRKILLAERQALDVDERARMDAAIAQRVMELPEFQDANVVFSYVSIGSEVDTRELIRAAWAAGKKVAAPRCVPHTRLLEWYAIDSFDGLVTSSFGIDEPERDRRLLVDSEQVGSINSIALVPGLTFDRRGYRLGYGGGFYDVFLSEYSGVSVGLCREVAFRNKLLRRGMFDLPVGIVATDERLLRI